MDETSPAVTKLLGYVREANVIAQDCFAQGNNELGTEALAVAAHYLQAARAMQDMHDASASYDLKMGEARRCARWSDAHQR